MAHESEEVIRIGSGSLVEVELWHQTLEAAGIHARVVGGDLASAIAGVVPAPVELWVLSGEAERALAVLQGAEVPQGERGHFRGPVASDPKSPHSTGPHDPHHTPARRTSM